MYSKLVFSGAPRGWHDFRDSNFDLNITIKIKQTLSTMIRSSEWTVQ
jgi:hypothetical protein